MSFDTVGLVFGLLKQYITNFYSIDEIRNKVEPQLYQQHENFNKKQTSVDVQIFF